MELKEIQKKGLQQVQEVREALSVIEEILMTNNAVELGELDLTNLRKLALSSDQTDLSDVVATATEYSEAMVKDFFGDISNLKDMARQIAQQMSYQRIIKMMDDMDSDN